MIGFPTLEIRQLTPVDAPALAAFLQRQPSRIRQWFHPFAFDVAAVGSALRDQSMALFALSHNELTLAAWLLRGLDNHDDYPELGLVVDSEHRRRGLGLLAVQIAQQQTRELDRPGLWLSVYPGNQPARRLYERAGFVETGKMPDGQVRMEWDAS